MTETSTHKHTEPKNNGNLKFLYKIPISEGYKPILNDPKEPKFEFLLADRITGKRFRFNDVDTIKFKRNKMIDMFFNVYQNSIYSLVESSFLVSEKIPISKVLQSIKQKTINTEFSVLGYIWIIDVGKNNRMHFHLVVAYPRIDIENKSLPKFLKYKFKNKKIYNAFINNRDAFKMYLKKKKVFERGYRKRTYNKSIKYKTIKTNNDLYIPNQIKTI